MVILTSEFCDNFISNPEVLFITDTGVNPRIRR
jgi:hypothetical protein